MLRTTSVSPLDRDKVTDLDLVKNANRIFPYSVASQLIPLLIFPYSVASQLIPLLASQNFISFLHPAASVSPLDRDKVTDLDLVKNAHRIFP